MKSVLIMPRFFELGNIHRAYATNSIGEALTTLGVVPLMPFYNTHISTLDEGEFHAAMLLETMPVGGIILQGGNDISPILYGQENDAAQGVQWYRDVVEVAIVKRAIEKKIPIFGICRGMQMINVALGGTLHQHLHEKHWGRHIQAIDNRYEEKDMDSIQHVAHEIILTEGGILETLLGGRNIDVNSYHHQGIDRLGDGLQIEAKSKEGLIEAISVPDHLILGLQWHPELDWQKEEFVLPLKWWVGQL